MLCYLHSNISDEATHISFCSFLLLSNCQKYDICTMLSMSMTQLHATIKIIYNQYLTFDIGINVTQLNL
jgi:hypothetical protein